MSYQEKEDKNKIPRTFEKKMVEHIKPNIIRPAEKFTLYGVTKSKSGVAEVSLALKLIMENGSQLAIQYHEFVSPMKFDGATLIEIATPTLSIKINGSNLQSIFDYLMEHRLVWIKEPDSSYTETKKGEAEIEKIEVEENK